MLNLNHLPFYDIEASDKLTIIKPFAPAIGKIRLPQSLIDDFNADIDDPKSKKEDWSERLVGKVKQEALINTEIIQPHAKFFSDCALNYIADYAAHHCYPFHKNTKPQIHITAAWFVSQMQNEFNPAHVHINGELSCIGYLKVPDGIEDEWADDGLDHHPSRGHVEFVYGTPSMLSKTMFTVRPRVGDFYIFPSDLIHMVYPFQTVGERRSFSMNLLINEKKPEQKELTPNGDK